ncbi:T9SS type A sorting domain-containing protein [Soonwooa sp.]|uniref:T9SS type A sorting domain-containing protein n=1 Tax=Soonwooa sp. TaxID=1938592 RepID=UPI00261D8261|nr:T9SS type A sorting domain-containing protein [Soonwooa sp.]
MKKLYSLKSVLLGAALTFGSVTAFAQATVDASLYEETFGDFGSSNTTFTASNMGSYDKRGTTTLVAADASSLTFTGASAMYSTATSTNTTSGHVWLNKSTTGYFQVSGIKVYNAKKVKVTFSQTGSGPINVLVNDVQVGSSSGAAAANTTNEFSVEGNETLNLKFQRTNTTQNLRVDNIKVVITEVTDAPCTAPTITSQPQDKTVAPGASTSFSVTASSANASDVLTYQWQAENEGEWLDIPVEFSETAQEATFVIDEANEGMNGTKLRVVVKNDTCETISNVVTLTVDKTLAVSNTNTVKVNLVKNTVITNEIIFSQSTKVSIVNMTGQIVKTADVKDNTRLDVSNLSKGTYIVTATVNGKAVSQKIIKK